MTDLLKLSPSDINEYIEKLQAAGRATGVLDEPPADLVVLATAYMDKQNVRLEFRRVLTDLGVVWEAVARTDRGVIVEQPEAGESWIDFLLRQGWLGRG